MRRRASGHQSMLMGVCRGGRPRRHVQLGEDVAEVSFNGLLTEHQHLRNVVVATSLGNQPEHLYLALGETTGPFPSQESIDLVGGRLRAHLSKGAAGDRKFRCRRVLITKLTQRTSN